jgi:hypothetical protein
MSALLNPISCPLFRLKKENLSALTNEPIETDGQKMKQMGKR